MTDKKLTKRPELKQSELIDKMPKACSDELAAVELFEEQRWGTEAHCIHCGSVDVYKMTDSETGQRNKRFLWRCHDCKQQFTVRIGTVYEDSRLPLMDWAYCFWRMSTSKKGIAAMEVMRHCQISYKSALFVLHRIRWAMAPDQSNAPKLTGIVEADETWVGGKPRKTGPFGIKSRAGRGGGISGTLKTPVIGVVQRNGDIRRRVVASVSKDNLKQMLKECVDENATLHTDELKAYRTLGREFADHQTVNHGIGEYARDDVHVNTAESSFAVLKRGITGIYHAVSKKHLHRYVSEFDFRWNGRKMNDGERLNAAIKSADGKRLRYREPVNPPKEPPKDGEQLPFWTV